jgi:hypothetical protein
VAQDLIKAVAFQLVLLEGQRVEERSCALDTLQQVNQVLLASLQDRHPTGKLQMCGSNLELETLVLEGS